MYLLKESERKSFSYKGLQLTALGLINQNSDFMGKMRWRNTEKITPIGYTWEDFNLQADKEGICTADIYLLEDELIVLTERGIANYLPTIPYLPKDSDNYIQGTHHWEPDSAGGEMYCDFVNGTEQKIYYEYTHFSKGKIIVVADTLADCRVYKNLWVNEKIRYLGD